MRFSETPLPGVWLILPEPTHDERGSFSRTFCEREFAEHGLVTRFAQHSVSRSVRQGTLRGLHFQRPPHAETKVVGCARGAIWDVAVDLRSHSPTFCRWQAFELTEENRHRLYIPEGCAHGFQTLTDDAEVTYLISTFYAPEAAAGVRFDDPTFGIAWPLQPIAISERDRGWPDFVRAAAGT
ncbi:MAG: dTDP-4-dehydrorhamnose 3,5-epimerase [Proteobacteria bacterium]|nr:dTDP-4-dehydrorhamnose 3,5-epimerase [Pseudomonadota bacterium]